MNPAIVEKLRILIFDDDEDILDLLRYNFSKQGFVVKVATNTRNAIKKIDDFQPNLVILDLMMDPHNGIEVCRMIREHEGLENLNVFFLTAKADQYYQQAAYTVGGDEFIEKIVGLKPLISKVNTVLKDQYIIRKRIADLKSGPLEIHRGLDVVYLNGDRLVLNKNEFDILFFLVQNEGKTIPLKQIITSLWGSTTFMDELSALNYIDNLRRKVGLHLIEERRMNLFRFLPEGHVRG